MGSNPTGEGRLMKLPYECPLQEHCGKQVVEK
jgi:hypothetical protein